MTQCYRFKLLMPILLVIMIAVYCINTHAEESKATAIKIHGVYSPKAAVVDEFHLTDNHGKPFSKENLMGHWTLMSFGFTNCGYVCPTTLTELKRMYAMLKTTLPSDELPQIIFVTIDPERDTVATMNQYMNRFNKQFIGLRGEAVEMQRFEKQLHITAKKIPDEDDPSEYVYNHSAEILVFNPEGKVQAYLAYPHDAKRLVKDYNAILLNAKAGS